MTKKETQKQNTYILYVGGKIAKYTESKSLYTEKKKQSREKDETAGDKRKREIYISARVDLLYYAIFRLQQQYKKNMLVLCMLRCDVT